jgi:hypothetical protein
MKLPLFIAHGAELAYAILVWYVGGMLISAFACWLGLKGRKTGALVLGLPALVLGGFLASNASFGLGWLPLGTSLVGLVAAFTVKPTEKKEAIQVPETTRGK